MKESTNIANRFSDAYIVAMLEGENAADVIGRYESAYPELGEVFRRNAKDLELLYGHIRKSELPSEAAIKQAYAKFKQEAAPAPREVRPAYSRSVSSKIISFFTRRPGFAGASFGIGLAVLFALFFQPWTQPVEQPVATGEKPAISPAAPQQQEVPQIAEGPKTSDPTVPEPTFRGGKDGQQKDKGHLDRSDRDRLSKLLVDNTLAAPTGVKVVGVSDSVIVVKWNGVKNALSYIIEVKRANEGEFKAVSQTSQTQARISGLPSSERVEFRVIAASGERKGEASAAKSITVP